MAVAAALAGSPVCAQPHTFTDTSGQPYVAQVLSVKNGEVTMRRTDGKVYTKEITALTDSDRKFLATWKPTPTDGPSTAATSDSTIGIRVSVEAAQPGDLLRLAAKVSLTNPEDCADFEGLQGTILLIGQQAGSTTKYKVLAQEKFIGDLPACGKFDFTGQPFNASSPAAEANEPAYTYKGYLFVLQNAQGNIIRFEHSFPFVKDGTEALKLRNGTIFNGPDANTVRQLQLVNNPDAWRANWHNKPPPSKTQP